MKRIRSGLMRTPFTVLNRTTTLDEFGQNVLAFLSDGTIIWGYLKGLNASEVVERERVNHSRTYENDSSEGAKPLLEHEQTSD